jgi:hypothetical protein
MKRDVFGNQGLIFSFMAPASPEDGCAAGAAAGLVFRAGRSQAAPTSAPYPVLVSQFPVIMQPLTHPKKYQYAYPRDAPRATGRIFFETERAVMGVT